MRKPIFVRPLSDAERQALEAGLRRSPDAFVLRRCQFLLASSRGETSYRIARSLGCYDQTARNPIKGFNDGGIEGALTQGSRRPRTVHAAFDPQRAEKGCARYCTRAPAGLVSRRACGLWRWTRRFALRRGSPRGE